jgi:hypothetical protein
MLRVLHVCKTTDVIVGNGRLCDDPGNCTYQCHNGQSVIDYVLLPLNSFCIVKHFEVLQHREFS